MRTSSWKDRGVSHLEMLDERSALYVHVVSVLSIEHSKQRIRCGPAPTPTAASIITRGQSATADISTRGAGVYGPLLR
jgi:hypothetical protein